ncbi:unnamed protein product [Allacma fusca]|uniref:Pre-mRNA-splicing regulator WTAP n=1 Tax=Allacma fusca TaxID=39272 RepID=A0A8J2PB20_9HEXA|nr:unnamed protein product [Allacma fusca]
MVENKPLSPSTESGQGFTGGSINLSVPLVDENSSPAQPTFVGDVTRQDSFEVDIDHGPYDHLPKDKDRPVLNDLELAESSREKLLDMYHQLQKYIDGLQNKHYDEVSILRESEEKLRGQQLEASRRENVLVMRLTMKEHEMQEYAAQLNELKSMMVPSTGALRSTLLDPAVNLLIQRMKKELEDTKKKLEDTQNDLNAWKFTPDSNTGKRLMAKCRMLYQENEELGKMITSGRLAKLETDLALQKSLTEEMRKAQAEMDDVVLELDEDIDGMQSTICFWQEQLKNQQQQNIQIDESKAIPIRTRHPHSTSDPVSNGPKFQNIPVELEEENESMDSAPAPEKFSAEGAVANLSFIESFAADKARVRTPDPNIDSANASGTVQNNSATSLNASSSMDGISEGDDDDEGS